MLFCPPSQCKHSFIIIIYFIHLVAFVASGACIFDKPIKGLYKIEYLRCNCGEKEGNGDRDKEKHLPRKQKGKKVNLNLNKVEVIPLNITRARGNDLSGCKERIQQHS